MFWYIKQSLKSLETSLFARKGPLIVFYQENKENVIVTSKRRSWLTISEFRIFSNVFVSNKTLFIIRILI